MFYRIIGLLLLFSTGLSAVTPVATSKLVFRSLDYIATAQSMKTLDDFFGQCAFAKRHHPGGWDYVEDTRHKHPLYKTVIINLTKYDFTSVVLTIRPELTVTYADVIAHYGKLFRTLPMKPDNFHDQMIAYKPKGKSQIVFTFNGPDQHSLLTEILIMRSN
ncbi:hypothetical protein A2311_01125 [candidate division WOR-1 bacterium RIFOXYB2_FULL_48_7]|uniref:Uncharacterized protein n=1 Tax=candidate division WOR-1 bacterium RIFOXYB2_FULL_48_7 TaxID=1802583 RepID=A0A1F4TNJ9_UNCSA|nr:MAG: hypothetical protein A2311_01125 [candidate division WOR-1 bacterium RIFOXYB2_FULL_48_7]